MGGEGSGSVIHLNGHPLLDFPLYVFFYHSFNNAAVFFTKIIFQRFDLLPERVKCRCKPIPMSPCLNFEFFYLQKLGMVNGETRQGWDVAVRFCGPFVWGQWRTQR